MVKRILMTKLTLYWSEHKITAFRFISPSSVNILISQEQETPELSEVSKRRLITSYRTFASPKNYIKLAKKYAS